MRSFPALHLCVLLGICWGFGGCASGELHLLDSGSDGGAAGSAASAPSGGTSASSGGTTTGGSQSGPTGGTCSGPGCTIDCPEGGHSGTGDPCGGCDPNRPGCRPCQTSLDCSSSAALCSPVTHKCVECTGREDCFGLFGGVKPVCWAGECSACQADADCPFGLACHSGECGQCIGDADCPSGLTCKNAHCAP
jgi:hypothetical protein